MLAYLVQQFSIPNEDRSTEMYISGSILVAVVLMVVFLTHHSFFGLAVVGMRFRISISSLVYRKVFSILKNNSSFFNSSSSFDSDSAVKQKSTRTNCCRSSRQFAFK